MHGEFRGALVPTGHPLHHRKVGLNDLLSLFEAFGQLIGVFGYPGEEPLHGHKVLFVAALLTHVVIPFLQSFHQVTLMIRSIDGFQKGTELPGNPVHAGVSGV